VFELKGFDFPLKITQTGGEHQAHHEAWCLRRQANEDIRYGFGSCNSTDDQLGFFSSQKSSKFERNNLVTSR